ncbi:MAG: hypothetical protein IKZ19_03215, partial [Clostridia bacterium]|nr:hypothetical protein [Clostridia bacterium]
NFDLVELSSDCIVLSLSQNEDTLSCYPFDFKLTITHKVFEGGFTSEYKVTNTGDRPLLYNLGGHPGINLPAIGTDTVEGCKLIFDTEETATVWYGDESIFVRDDYVRTDVLQGTDTILCTDELFDNDALMIGNMNSHSVKLISPCGKGVEMDYTGFPVLGVWTAPKKHAPFLCLEPWHGLPSKTFESGEFCDKPYVITLAPAEENTLA